jgi:lysozyme
MPLDQIKSPSNLRAILERDEGVRPFPYADTMGSLTIGIGHNLTAKGVTKNVQELMYQEDIKNALDVLDTVFPAWPTLGEVRQIVFISLAFNMGYRLAQFKHMLEHASRGAWRAASNDLQNSLWFRQVGKRGPRLVSMLRTGRYFD